jgi:hypothetical protein
MKTKKIAFLVGTLIPVTGCLGDKSDARMQSTTGTKIGENADKPMRHVKNSTLAQQQRRDIDNEIREMLGLPENATNEEIRNALQEMRGSGEPPFNGSRPPFNDTYKQNLEVFNDV